MKSNYKRLGQYIEFLDSRAINHESILDLDSIKGISSISKDFIKTRANLIGVTADNYKVVETSSFAYNPNTARMGDKIPIALNQFDFPVLVSSIYPTFKIKNINELLPEYLMMWFRRVEFDRYARYVSHGSAREVFDIEEMNGLMVPIPSITKQKEIVKEYNTIVNRINLNKQLIQKLEETAQAIYKHWFVDFEFPNENGRSYKSSGGEMVKSELGDIPIGWEVRKISSLCQITSSKRIFESEYKKEGVPFYRAGEIKQKKEGITIKDLLYISKDKFLKISKSFGHPLSGDILLTAVGSLLGDSYLVENETFYFKDGNVVWFRKFVIEECNLYLYEYLQSDSFKELLNEIKIGSGQSAITIQSLNEKLIIKPSDMVLKIYQKPALSINTNIAQFKKQNSKLYELRDLLLSKLATIEN